MEMLLGGIIDIIGFRVFPNCRITLILYLYLRQYITFSRLVVNNEIELQSKVKISNFKMICQCHISY